MQDLETLRRWRSGHSSRVLVLSGYEGSAGVTLIQFSAGERRTASYDSVSSAALAVRDGQVPWRLVAAGQRKATYMGKSNAARRDPAIKPPKVSTPKPIPKAPRVPRTPEQLIQDRRDRQAKYRAGLRAKLRAEKQTNV